VENGVAERAGSGGAAARPAVPGRVARVSIAVALIVVADQITKSIAVARWSSVPRQIVGTHVELFVTRNSGSAFSRFQNLTPLLALGAIAIAVILARAARTATDRVTLYALVLLLGGALGNLTDRFARSPGILRGHVVDFVQIGWWPVFNLADSCVTIGAVLLIVRGLLPPRDAAPTGPAPTGPAPTGPAPTGPAPTGAA
jgi:signal peptidase II